MNGVEPRPQAEPGHGRHAKRAGVPPSMLIFYETCIVYLKGMCSESELKKLF